MKKVIVFLCIAMLQCISMFSQNVSEHFSSINNTDALKAFQSSDTLKLVTTNPEDVRSFVFESKWSLEKTENIEGGKIEHYVREVNDEEIHWLFYIMDDGDLVIKNEKNDQMPDAGQIKNKNYKIIYFKTRVQGIDNQEAYIEQRVYSSGLVFKYISYGDRNRALLYLPNQPYTGYKVFYWQRNGINKFNKNEDIRDYKDINGKWVNLPKVFFPRFHFSGHDEFDIVKGPNSRSAIDYIEHIPGCLIGDRWYYFYEETGELKPAGLQYLPRKTEPTSGKLFFASPKDTLTDVIYYQSKTDSVVFHYKNGDKYKMAYSYNGDVNWSHRYETGTIHRFGGILKLKKKTDLQSNKVYTDRTLTMPNGTIIKIDTLLASGPIFRKNQTQFNDYHFVLSSYLYPAFGSDSLQLYSGTITHPDGREIKITRGLTPEELKEEQKVNEAKKKREEAENAKKRAEEENEIKAQYNELCRMYGKKYVDAALQGSQNQTPPLVGMPERLFVGAYKAERFSQTGNTTSYRVYGWGVTNNRKAMTLGDKILKYTVTVKNGKVASVFTHR